MAQALSERSELNGRAAQYVRMSTDHQQYSTQNQMDAIRRYAETRSMQIVRTYSDGGKSGVNIAGRDALRELIDDVQNRRADFAAVLVYDVSRWGRFQDSDESAYYEYVCKRAGVRVHYCAEQFENDGSLPSTLLKTIKRTMAGEYSRELSVKVFAGQCRLIELGYRQGGPAGYGLRRQLIDRAGNRKEILTKGEYKSIQTDRIILIKGPEEEVAVVREIFDLFVNQGQHERLIAARLNARGLVTDYGRPWTWDTVHEILSNPKYVGDSVYNRTSEKLGRRQVNNPPEIWIRHDNAFEAVVSRELFLQAAYIIQRRKHHYTNEELLDALKDLLSRIGSLSGILIDEAENMPPTSLYRSRFGSLSRAYSLIGYTPMRDFRYVEINRVIRELHRRQCSSTITRLTEAGAVLQQDTQTGLLKINDEFTVSLVFARCREVSFGNYRWLIRLENSLDPDVTIAGRLRPGNDDVLDYYLLPRIDTLQNTLSLRNDNGIILDVYRFDNLDFFISMARRVRVEDAA